MPAPAHPWWNLWTAGDTLHAMRGAFLSCCLDAASSGGYEPQLHGLGARPAGSAAPGRAGVMARHSTNIVFTSFAHPCRSQAHAAGKAAVADGAGLLQLIPSYAE